jgi:hypothetical protein
MGDPVPSRGSEEIDVSGALRAHPTARKAKIAHLGDLMTVLVRAVRPGRP